MNNKKKITLNLFLNIFHQSEENLCFIKYFFPTTQVVSHYFHIIKYYVASIYFSQCLVGFQFFGLLVVEQKLTKKK